MKKIGVALGGGGARGVAHIAYLKAMDEMGLRPHIIAGTSSGAIAGALYAGGLKPEEIMELLHHLFKAQSKDRSAKIKLGRIPSSLRETIARKYLQRILPKTQFEDLEIPLKVVATNFHTLQERVFDSGDLLSSIMASIALPSAFLPQKVDGQYYMDGGATNIVPFDIIRDACDILIAIDVSLVRPSQLKPTLKNANHATWAATQDAYIRLKLEHCPVEIFERPTFDNISTMEFYKYKKIYNQALEYLPGFIEKLKKVVIKG